MGSDVDLDEIAGRFEEGPGVALGSLASTVVARALQRPPAGRGAAGPLLAKSLIVASTLCEGIGGDLLRGYEADRN